MPKKTKTKRRPKGLGSITEIYKGKFRGYITVGYDPKTGHPIRKYFWGNHPDEVQQEMIAELQRLNAGTFSDPQSLSLSHWLDRWMEVYKKPNLKIRTFNEYQSSIDRHIKPEFGQLKLKKIKTSHIQQFFNNRAVSGRLDGHEGGLGKSSLHQLYVILNSALKQACSPGERLLNINPVDGVKIPEAQGRKREVFIFEPEELQIFLEAVRNTRYFSLYALELSTGLRRGEIVALKKEDFNLSNKRLKVSGSRVRVKGNVIHEGPKSKKGNRIIPLSQEIIPILEEHQKMLQEEKAKNKNYKDQGYFFCNRNGAPYHPDTITTHCSRVMEKLLAEGKIKRKITFHGLRHSFASLAARSGSITALQEMLGHYAADFTWKTYIHSYNEDMQEIANNMGEILSGKNSKKNT